MRASAKEEKVMGEMGEKRRNLGAVADDLLATVLVARKAMGSASTLGLFRDDAVSELAQAVVLLGRAAARFNSCCGMNDPADGLRIANDAVQRFVCPDCGYRVKADEDGCCATCGRDCAILAVVAEPDDMTPSATA